jgi:hypothetical protein
MHSTIEGCTYVALIKWERFGKEEEYSQKVEAGADHLVNIRKTISTNAQASSKS